MTTGFTINKNFGLDVDFYSQRSTCQKDDIYQFKPDGTYVREESINKYSPDTIVEKGKRTKTGTIFTLQV